MGCIDRSTAAQRFENRLDEAVARVAGQAFAVGAEVRQFAAAIPDRHGRAGGNLAGAGECREGFQVAQRGRQPTLAAGFLDRIKLDPLRHIFIDQLGKVLLVADVARARRVPEMHQAYRARAGQIGRQAQRVAGKHRGVLAESPQETALEPVVGHPQDDGASEGEQAGEQGRAVGRAHGVDPLKPRSLPCLPRQMNIAGL